jgi:hypothetical protein
MSDKIPEVQGALSDVALIRQVLDRVEERRGDTSLFGISLDANLLLQICAFIGVLAFLGLELFGSLSISELVAQNNDSPEAHREWIGMIGFSLFMLLLILYFVLWRAARHSQEDMTAYIATNFRYARNLNFISDLLIKFVALSLIVLAGQGGWVAPLLLAFTGDYLLQGRLFTLPNGVSQVVGVLCLIGAGIQFFYFSGNFAIPLVVFAVICGCSLIRLGLHYRSVSA